MAFAPGTRFGSYQFAEAIGVGGMDEVYRARDTELGRDVLNWFEELQQRVPKR